MATALDIVLLLAIPSESLRVARSLPLHTWAAFVVILPFCLGVGSALRAGPTFVQNYMRVAVGQGLTLLAAMIYMGMVFRRGLDLTFVGLFAITLVHYGLGRL